VACVAGPLERYGFLPTIQGEQRKQVLGRFAQMYQPAVGSGLVMDYMSETGLDSLKAKTSSSGAAEVLLDGAVSQ